MGHCSYGQGLNTYRPPPSHYGPLQLWSITHMGHILNELGIVIIMVKGMNWVRGRDWVRDRNWVRGRGRDWGRDWVRGREWGRGMDSV